MYLQNKTTDETASKLLEEYDSFGWSKIFVWDDERNLGENGRSNHSVLIDCLRRLFRIVAT